LKSLQQQVEDLVNTYTPYELAEMLVKTEDALEDYRIRSLMFYEIPSQTFANKLGQWWKSRKGGSNE
tara:strand:+ start:84152 stop:84352 length:201 start_codon:yes stop_codon:yes gene_type:complete